jgi:uncharacterized protein YjbI with pentapeptide repeats
MNKDKLIKVLADHKLWLDMKLNGKRADLRSVDLQGIDLRYANLKSADMSRAKLKFVNLKGANLIGADLDDAELFGALLLHANLINANLIEANLIDAQLNGANLTRASLEGADLRSANLCDAVLEATDLTDTNLILAKYNKRTIFPEGFDPQERGMVHEDDIDADEEESSRDYEEAISDGAQAAVEQLLKTIRSESDSSVLDWDAPNLSWLDLNNCNLANGNLSNANLRWTDLQNANLANSNLTNAQCTFTNFSGADLTEANLANADLSNANLLGTIMSLAKYNQATTFPNGFNPVSKGMLSMDVDMSSETTIEQIIIEMQAEIEELSKRKDFLEEVIKEIQSH